MENLKNSLSGDSNNGKISDLIEHQSIYIDAHGHELDPNVKDDIFDDTKYDLHLHKRTKKVRINNKQEYIIDIQIPINNPEREITVKKRISENAPGVKTEVPGRLNREIRNAFRDKKVRDAFAKSVVKEMREYHSKQFEGEQEKAQTVLKRIGKAFGVPEIPVKDEWFTHINHSNAELSAYSIIDFANQRYNFYASRDFVFSEKAEPTHKFILGLYAGAASGKSETIKIVLQILLERFPENAIVFENGEDGGDVKALLFVHGAKVGIESQGDPWSRQMQSIKDFTDIGCDIILSASRTRGMTTKSIMAHQDQYKIYWYYKNRDTERNMWHERNVEMAYFLADQIEAFAFAAFAGL